MLPTVIKVCAVGAKVDGGWSPGRPGNGLAIHSADAKSLLADSTGRSPEPDKN